MDINNLAPWNWIKNERGKATEKRRKREKLLSNRTIIWIISEDINPS